MLGSAAHGRHPAIAGFRDGSSSEAAGAPASQALTAARQAGQHPRSSKPHTSLCAWLPLPPSPRGYRGCEEPAATSTRYRERSTCARNSARICWHNSRRRGARQHPPEATTTDRKTSRPMRAETAAIVGNPFGPSRGGPFSQLRTRRGAGQFSGGALGALLVSQHMEPAASLARAGRSPPPWGVTHARRVLWLPDNPAQQESTGGLRRASRTRTQTPNKPRAEPGPASLTAALGPLPPAGGSLAGGIRSFFIQAERADSIRDPPRRTLQGPPAWVVQRM